MSAETVVAIGTDVKAFFAKLTADLQRAKQAWQIISSPQTRSVLLALGADVVRLVKDAGAAAGAKGLSLSLDAAVLQDVQQLIKDAEAGDLVLVQDLKMLGLTL